MTQEIQTYESRERARAARWKANSATLPEEARFAAPWEHDGKSSRRTYEFCLPRDYAALNLLPEVRDQALLLFAELGIPWHQGIAGGPGNHLLSSQVQCANALGQMIDDPDRIGRAFGQVIDVGELLEIEPGRFLTFEFIGDTDYFNESPNEPRVRGSKCTSIDAAFTHRLPNRVIELVLIEWKHTEKYAPRRIDPTKDAVRWGRYGSAWSAPDSPVRTDLVSFDALLAEPFYQLVRQQLLAWRIENDPAQDAGRVKVVHVHSPANDAYQHSIHTPALAALGDKVDEVWSKLLKYPDRYSVMNPTVFCDPSVTSAEYVLRYAEERS